MREDANKKALAIGDILAAVFCNVLFGSAGVVIKLSYEFLELQNNPSSQILFAGIRFFISGVIVFCFAWTRKKSFPTFAKESKGNIFAVALFYTFLQYVFYYLGLSNTKGASASIISSSSVFIAVILSHFIYTDDKITLRKGVGVTLGFFGVILATLMNGSIGSVSVFGEGLIFLSALCFVLGSMLNKRATKIEESYTVSSYNLLFGGTGLILLGVLLGGNISTFNVEGGLALLFLAMISSVGFTIWSGLCKKYPIGKLSVYSFIIPVSGVLFSAVFLKENIFKWQYLIALLLVSVSIMIVNYKKSKP